MKLQKYFVSGFLLLMAVLFSLPSYADTSICKLGYYSKEYGGIHRFYCEGFEQAYPNSTEVYVWFHNAGDKSITIKSSEFPNEKPTIGSQAYGSFGVTYSDGFGDKQISMYCYLPNSNKPVDCKKYKVSAYVTSFKQSCPDGKPPLYNGSCH